jgi:integrase
MIAEVLAVYGAEVAPHKKTARNISYNIGNLLKWWGDKKTSDINTKACRAYAATKTASGAGSDIKVLRSAVMHWHAEYGPLNAVPIFWKPAENPPKERWLTRSEAARLLWTARRYEHLRRMILLGLYTGSRPGVILSLRWDQIDFKAGYMSRTRQGVTQDKRKRAPKVKLGRRIMSHLKRWKRIDGDATIVCRFSDVWHPGERAVIDPHSTWRKVVTAAKLPGVTRHTLRHTRATWMMQAGVPIWEAAGFLGMTVKTLERVYGHHSPDHQETAANI